MNSFVLLLSSAILRPCFWWPCIACGVLDVLTVQVLYMIVDGLALRRRVPHLD